jgi:DNA mismatch endonuclease (patch repair protein)
VQAMDVFTKEKRSEIMSKIRAEGTQAELAVFKELRKRKIYFQKHYKKAVGKPDIALPSKKKAIFIDGDFWHGYNFSKIKSKLPKKYWLGKIEGNIARDKRNKLILKKNGWKVLRVWEHEIEKNLFKIVDKIQFFLEN